MVNLYTLYSLQVYFQHLVVKGKKESDSEVVLLIEISCHRTLLYIVLLNNEQLQSFSFNFEDLLPSFLRKLH